MKRWSQVLNFNKSFDSTIFDDITSLPLTRSSSSNDIVLLSKVKQYLKTLALQNNDLIVLKDHNAILRRDHVFLDQVKVLCGGACGNEPLHAGLVGHGLLTGAVLGDFTSCPSHSNILAVIRELSRNNASVFVVIMNYASYRLNFGIAIQNALSEGINVASVIVEDDCSGVVTDKTVGRRTLAGLVFMLKVVGAMAEDRKTLYEIECISKSICKNNLGTINVHLDKHEAVFGIGLKGEAGKSKLKIMNHDSDEIVKNALAFIVDPASYFSLALKKNDNVAILVNNFKSLTDLDLGAYVNGVVRKVNNIPLNVVSLNFGNYLSSEFINGFSITLFKVDNPRVLKWLTDQSNHGKLFMKTKPIKEIVIYEDNKDALIKKLEPSKPIGPKFKENDKRRAVKVLNSIMNQLFLSEEYINSIDFDGDCGTALCNFAIEVQNKLDHRLLKMNTPHGLLTSLNEIAETTMGGLSSGIYSVMFSSAAQAFVRYSSLVNITPALWAEAVCMANRSIYSYLRVRPGCRTIVDALHPFAEALQKNPNDLRGAIDAAEKGVESTINMKPKAYKEEDKQDLTSPDAGAYAFMLALNAAYTALA